MMERFIEKSFKVTGMTCTSCEKTIHQSLKSLKGVKAVQVSYKKSRVTIQFNPKIVTFETIMKTIEECGYRIGAKDRQELFSIVLILWALYLIIKHTVGFDFVPRLDQSVSYGLLFTIGLLTSFHCIAMCGGINLSQCLPHQVGDEDNKLTALKPSLLYNLGRIVSYTIIGGIVGLIGSAISFSDQMTNYISVFAGLFMLLLGLKMLNIIPALRQIQFKLPVPKRIRYLINKKKRVSGPFVVGLLNGFMPCGPLQTMQVYALATGSFLVGALSMFFFSLGTLPLMFGFGALGSLLSGRFKQSMTKFSGVLIVVLGLVMANRGLNINLFAFFGPKGEVAVMKEDYQYVKTTFTNGNYKPIVVEEGVPVIWEIEIAKEDINGCNYQMIIPDYYITYTLKPGTNIIEFTPNKSGTISYYCYMRMIRSQISVVDELP